MDGTGRCGENIPIPNITLLNCHQQNKYIQMGSSVSHCQQKGKPKLKLNPQQQAHQLASPSLDSKVEMVKMAIFILYTGLSVWQLSKEEKASPIQTQFHRRTEQTLTGDGKLYNNRYYIKKHTHCIVVCQTLNYPA